MKSAMALMAALLALPLGTSPVSAGGTWQVNIPATQSDLSPMFSFIKEIRHAFEDYDEARMPLEQREAWANRIARVCQTARPGAAENVELYVHACYECTTFLTSMNMGERRFEMCQAIVAGCLPYIDAVPVPLAMDLASQMSYALDLDGRPLTPQSRSAYRNTFVEYRLRVWRRVAAAIDPTWKENDPNNAVYANMAPPGGAYPSGVAPEGIKEPEIRQAYEKLLAENHRKAKRNNQQITARRNADTWRKRALGVDMVSLYGKGPVTDEDWEMLKAYLRVYVSDDGLRQEIYGKCRKAAGAEGEKER
ncbi:MAG: hypothetical protein PHU85_13805 [Phycisphaerae bacterium]|nr:hypothetical protein [Phycisphaerae bacterium]